MTKADYESLTVAELKEMAEFQGIPIPSDARKADIIEALQALEAEGKAEVKEGESVPEQQNVYTYQTSSTTEGLMSQEDFHKVKLSV